MLRISSANAKKWEVELATLKNNNARLTSALQESTANVEEWKRQLQAYKEENTRVKNKIAELEAGRLPSDGGSGGNGSELKRDAALLRVRVESLEAELRTKDDEIRRISNDLRDTSLANDKMKVSTQSHIHHQQQLQQQETNLSKAVAIWVVSIYFRHYRVIIDEQSIETIVVRHSSLLVPIWILFHFYLLLLLLL